MTEKQSILGRISQLCTTDVRALLASTSDPGAMLDQFVRDLTATIAESEEAIAVTEGNLRLAELDLAEDRKAAEGWASAAQAAWDRGDEIRNREGHTNPTDFDSLAESARNKQQAAEGSISSTEPLVAAQAAATNVLKDGLTTMRAMLVEIKANRQDLVAAASAVAGGVPAASVNVMDPDSDLRRFRTHLEQLTGGSADEPDAATDIAEHLTPDSPESAGSAHSAPSAASAAPIPSEPSARSAHTPN